MALFRTLPELEELDEVRIELASETEYESPEKSEDEDDSLLVALRMASAAR